MSAIWTALTSRLAGPIASGVALLLAILLLASRLHIGSLEQTNDTLTKANTSLTAALAISRANVATLEAAVARQNAALETLRAQSDARAAQLQQSLAVTRAQTQTAQQRAAAILARRPGADQCASALDAIRGN